MYRQGKQTFALYTGTLQIRNKTLTNGQTKHKINIQTHTHTPKRTTGEISQTNFNEQKRDDTSRAAAPAVDEDLRKYKRKSTTTSTLNEKKQINFFHIEAPKDVCMCVQSTYRVRS